VQEGHNPVCGDHLFIYLLLDEKGETIMDLTFQGEGCAISKASASMMTAALKGKTLTQARHLFEEFHRLLTRQLDPTTQEHHLGKLQVFASIWKYPARVKCAGLCWHTLKAALEGVSTIINTEG
jgi:nitrogen fixation NifU-like protein